MDILLSKKINDLEMDAHYWRIRGRRDSNIRISESALIDILNDKDNHPDLFYTDSIITDYLTRADILRQKRKLILSIKGGQITPALEAKKKLIELGCSRLLNIEDRGNEFYQLKLAFYAAVTNDDSVDEEFIQTFRLVNDQFDATPQSVFDDSYNVNVTTTSGRTPLYWAAVFGHFDLVKQLIKKGAKPDKLTDDEGTILLDIAYAGHLKIFKFFVEEHRIDPLKPNRFGSTPMVWAIQQKHDDIKDYLLQRGAQTRFLTKERWSTLTETVRSGSLAAVKTYGLADFNVNEPAYFGIRPLFVACQYKTPAHFEIAKFLLEEAKAEFLANEDGFSPLHLAAQYGNIEIIKLLLDSGVVDVNLQDNYAQSPLVFAVSNQQYATVRFLLEHQAKIDNIDKNGYTPLIIAVINGYAAIVRLLLDWDADPDVWPKDNGWGPLHYAADDGDIAIVEMLVADRRVNLNATVKPGWTAMMLAALKGHAEVISLLLTAKADASLHYRETDALKIAHDHRKFEVIEIIKDWAKGRPAMQTALQRQSEREAQSHSRHIKKQENYIEKQASFDLFTAAKNGDLETIKNSEISLDERNEHGQNIIDIAASFGQKNVVDYLIEEKGAEKPYLWQCNRVSDEATFLHFEDIPAQEIKWLSKELENCGDNIIHKPGENPALRRAKLPFYKHRFLLAIEYPWLPGRREQFAIYSLKKDFVLLDWTNEPIYTVNEQGPLNLSNDENVIAYCRFFFHFVRGQLGKFQFLDPKSTIPWITTGKGKAKKADKAKLNQELEKLPALNVIERETKHIAAQGTCLFKNALFTTKILIAKREHRRIDPETNDLETFSLGQMKLYDEELILENLRVTIDFPPGKLG
jgi:ankyrin repeat protein